MSQLPIVTLCQFLSNLTHNRCVLTENFNTCRCFIDMVNPVPNAAMNPAPQMMMSEVILIFFVLALWLSAIGFCLNQYKSLRRLETQVHYCVTRKDPLNIGEIKIVTREQDSIIYKKKRYSTALDPQIDTERLKAMRYVQQYLPKATSKTMTSTQSAARNEFYPNRSFSKSSDSPSSAHRTLPPHHEVAEEQSTTDLTVQNDSIQLNGTVLNLQRAGSARLPTGLTVPHISSPSSLQSGWNDSSIHETSRSTQHLCVPMPGLRSNRFSDGNITIAVPTLGDESSSERNEELIDPRLIPESVRRSLLALHRESQENVHMQRQREKTQSENDVHGAFHPWKIKMQSKLKRTHHHDHRRRQQQQQEERLLSSPTSPPRTHTNTLAILPVRQNSNEQESRFPSPSSSPMGSYRTTPSFRRSLVDYPKYSTQSTSESETTQDLPILANIQLSATNIAESERMRRMSDASEKRS